MSRSILTLPEINFSRRSHIPDVKGVVGIVCLRSQSTDIGIDFTDIIIIIFFVKFEALFVYSLTAVLKGKL